MSHKILINKKKRAEDVGCCEQKYLLSLEPSSAVSNYERADAAIV